MSDWLMQFGSLWIWLLIALALVILLIFVVLTSMVRSGSHPAPDHRRMADDPGEPETDEDAPADAGRAKVESASTSFNRAIAYLRSSVPGRDYRYQIPWYAVLGDPGAGTSSLMRSVGVDIAPSRSHRPNSLEWRFLDRGILIGVPGSYARGGSGRVESDWGRLLKQFQNRRPRRPLDGIVLAVPATDLYGPAALDETQLSARASRFSDMLAQAQRTFGFLFPVYVIVTKCDELDGFDAFCRELPSKSRDDIFGWSSPYQLDAAFTPEWIDEAFATTSQELQRLQSEIFVEQAELANPDDVFLFPEEFARLRAPVGVFLDRLFRETAYRESFRFRGLYFCGDFTAYSTPSHHALEDTPADVEPWMAAVASEATPPPPVIRLRKTPAFLKRLFEEKIFAEYGVARPLAKNFLTKSRTVGYIQTTAAALALLLAAGVAFSYERLAGDRDRLLPALMKMTGPVPKLQTPDERKTFGLGLLQSMDGASTVKFWSPFVPASWFSPLDDSVTQIMKAACEQWVFSGMQAELLQRKNKLLYPGPDPEPDGDPAAAPSAQETDPQPSAVTTLESAPEYQDLQQFIAGLQGIEEATSIYESLRQQGQVQSLVRIRKLLNYLDLTEIQPRGHLLVALQSASGPPAPITLADQQRASETIKELLDGLLRNWFDNNVAWNDVERLRSSIGDLQRGQSAGYQQLKNLLGFISRAENDFTDPSFRWLSNSNMDLPPSLQRVSANPLAGPKDTEISSYSRQLGEQYLNQTRNNLRDERTALTGPLLDIKNPIDLSPGAKQLQVALENTVNLPFLSATIETRPIMVSLEPNRRIMWRLDALHEAQRLTGIYNQYVRDGLRGTPDALNTALSRLALTHLTQQVQDLIVQAEVIQPRPAPSTGAVAEDETLPEVNAFREASESLVQLADQYNSLGQVYIHNAVLRVMVMQAFNLLTILDNRLNEEQAYGIKDGAWTGNGPMSFAVFDVAGAPALTEYLAAQRDRIKFFEQQAQPLVPFLLQYMPVRAVAQNQLIAKWQKIIDDFHQYDAKRPGAPLSALEDFITTGVDKIPARACKPEGPPDQRQDYFVQIRNSLESRLDNRCREVSATSVCSSYARIAGQFNQLLAGKFPFGPLTNTKTQLEANPEDITAFYKTFDASSKTARDALEDGTRFGEGGDRARQFLDAVDRLRFLVVPATPETEKEPPLTLDFLPQFRVNRTNEAGGSQIVNWTMQIGGQIFQQKDPEHAGRWRPGNPVRLSLRWANDSTYTPVPDSSQPDLTIRDRNAYFEFTDRWSLLAFLRRHEAVASDLGQSSDPQPYTLKFRVRTATDPKWAGAEVDPPTAVTTVFLHIKLMTPGGKTAVTLPAFPVSASTLGAACESVTRYGSELHD